MKMENRNHHKKKSEEDGIMITTEKNKDNEIEEREHRWK